MNLLLKLFSVVAFFFFVFFVFPSQARAFILPYDCYDGTQNCYGTNCQGTGSAWHDVPMQNCINNGNSPPANTCNASGDWIFSYYVCQYRQDPSTGLCTDQVVPKNFTCSAADACEGTTGGGGTGYSANGHVVAGHCSIGNYVEGNPSSACTSYGYYKQCCSPGGTDPTTYCSNGLCPAGTITSAFVTSCGAPLPAEPRVTGIASYCTSTSVTTASLTFSWTGGSGATSFQVRYGQDSPSFTQTVTMGASPYTINGFTPGHRIYYNVYACNASGCTADSNGYYYVDLPGSCNGVGGTSPTPTWTPTPPPGPPPTPTDTPAVCRADGTYCGTAGAPLGGCCSGVCDCSVNPLNCTCAPTGGSGCLPSGVAGCGTGGSFGSCCAGLQCSGGTCGPPVTCLSCEAYSSGACWSQCGPGLTCSPTNGGTCVPTTYTITGLVFIDTDRNGVWDPGCVQCQNPHPAEPAYTSGASVKISGGNNATTTTNSSGQFFFNETAGSYAITLTVPPNYIATSSNPLSLSMSGDVSVRFGIAPLSPPTCTGLTADPPIIPAGGESNLSLNGCSPLNPPPGYSWTPPTTGTLPACTGPTCIYTAPPAVCVNTPVVHTARIFNAAGSNSYSTTVTVTPLNQVTGDIFLDNDGNNCASGATHLGAGVTLTEYSGGVQSGIATSNAGGTYTLADTAACGARTLVISGTSPYVPKAISLNQAPFSSTNLSGYTYSYNLNTATSVDWCLSTFSAWYQTANGGDVRFNRIVDNMPAGQSLALGASGTTGVLFSTNGTQNLGSGTASPAAPAWVVTNEFGVNNDSSSILGNMSYSFYLSRLSQFNISPVALPGCPSSAGKPIAGDCNLDLATAALTTNVYQVLGNLTLRNSFTVPNGAHIVILVSGATDIGSGTNAGIAAAAGNRDLFVLAGKGDVRINPSVGTAASLTTPNLAGYYTSEANILIQSSANCQTNTPDTRLNVEGTLIANSLHPFTVNGGGAVTNYRSLCANNGTYPSYYVKYRPDFLTQFTDFYKSTLKTFREVAP